MCPHSICSRQVTTVHAGQAARNARCAAQTESLYDGPSLTYDARAQRSRATSVAATLRARYQMRRLYRSPRRIWAANSLGRGGRGSSLSRDLKLFFHYFQSSQQAGQALNVAPTPALTGLFRITLRGSATCRSESICTAAQTDQTINARIDGSRASGGMCPHSARSRQVTTVHAGRAPEGREAKTPLVI